MKELKMLFENNEVEIITDDNGNLLFEIYSTGMALGYINYGKNKNNPLPHKTRINKTLENVDVKGCVHGVNTYINENELYDFLLEAHTKKCKSFRKWVVTEVLPTINKTGGYVEENRETEFIENYFPNFADETKKSMVQDLLKTNQEFKKEIDELKPKADAYDDIINSDGYMSLKEVGDMIEIGRSTLCNLLRNKNVMSKQTGYNLPLNRYTKAGYFKVVAKKDEKGHTSPVTIVSTKGLNYIYKIIKKNEMLDKFNIEPLLAGGIK